MDNRQQNQVLWLEEKSFVFDCIMTSLRTVAPTNDPLAALATALLFHELDEPKVRDRSLANVEDILHALPPVEGSGLQLRDCLIASGYLYIARRTGHDPISVEHLVLDRVGYAAQSNWFDDAELATIIALIGHEVQVGAAARQFLKGRLENWLSDDYLPGVLACCLAGEVDKPLLKPVVSYLTAVQWPQVDLPTLTRALLALGKLIPSAQTLQRVQFVVAEHVLNVLGNSPSVYDPLSHSHPSRTTTCTLTPFDLACAAYALHHEGFDRVVGVRRHQRDALQALVGLQRILQRGGAVIPRRQLVMLEITFVGCLFLVLFELIRLTGVDALWPALIDVLVPTILAGIAFWLLRRGLPSTGAGKALFGDAAIQDDGEGQSNGSTN